MPALGQETVLHRVDMSPGGRWRRAQTEGSDMVSGGSLTLPLLRPDASSEVGALSISVGERGGRRNRRTRTTPATGRAEVKPLVLEKRHYFPHFADRELEKEYVVYRNERLAFNLKKTTKVAGLLILIFLPIRGWGFEDVGVDLFFLVIYPLLWLMLLGVTILANRCNCSGRCKWMPISFDMFLALFVGLPIFVALGLSPYRIGMLLGRLGPDASPNNYDEAIVVCQLSLSLAATTHLAQLSPKANIVLIHLTVGAFWFGVATFGSDFFTFWNAIWVSGFVYMQALVAFAGTTDIDYSKRRMWLLRKVATQEVSEIQAQKSGRSSCPPSVDTRIPHSVQEEAAKDLEIVSASLERLIEQRVVTDADGRLAEFAELLRIFNISVDKCLTAIRRATSAPVGKLWRGRGQPVLVHFAMDEYLKDPEDQDDGVLADGTDSDNLSTRTRSAWSFTTPLLPDLATVLSPGGDTTAQANKPEVAMDNDISFGPEVDEELAALRGEVGISWNFDVLDMEKKSRGRSFLLTGIELLAIPTSTGLLKKKETREFLNRLVTIYKPTPYHNAIHGADVASGFSSLIRKCPTLVEASLGPQESPFAKDLMRTACAVAALAHDVGHPGKNNAFLASTMAPLAVTYNDNSVLENFHAAVTFSVLLRPNTQIFTSLELAQFMAFRRLVVELILVTDLKVHFSQVADFRLRLTDPEFGLAPVSKEMGGEDGDEESSLCGQERNGSGTLAASAEEAEKIRVEGIRLVLKMLIKAADLGHSAKTWAVHQEWSLKITEEFHTQGDEERRLGLPVAPMNNREGFDLAESQRGFLKFLCLPLWTEVAHLDEPQHAGNGFGDVLTACEDNLAKWQEQSDVAKKADAA